MARQQTKEGGAAAEAASDAVSTNVNILGSADFLENTVDKEFTLSWDSVEAKVTHNEKLATHDAFLHEVLSIMKFLPFSRPREFVSQSAIQKPSA